MAEVNQCKTKREVVRSRITKLLKSVDKLLAEDLRKLDKHKLEPKLSALEQMVKEHNSAFNSLLEAMTADSAPEEEIEKEIDNSDKKAQCSDYVDRMNRTLRREALLSKYSWLDYATDIAPDFATREMPL